MKFATVFRDFEKVHLTKDVGMIPMSMTKLTGNKASLFYWNRDESIVDEDYSDLIELRPVKAVGKIHFIIKVLMHIIKEQYSTINLYHLKNETLLVACILHFFSVDVYLKLDMDSVGLEHIKNKLKKSVLYKFVLCRILNNIKNISVETNAISIELKKVCNCFNKVKLLPNSILRDTIGVSPIEFASRDNVILVSGRIGAYQKNHELILACLDKVNFCDDWRIVFAGPVSDDFYKRHFNDLMLNDFNKKVTFLGVLSRSEIMNLYARSKIFLMPSRREGFSLALLEAAFMGCYIIATDVGGVREVTRDGVYGRIISQNDVQDLTITLDNVMSGAIDTETLYKERMQFLTSNFDLEKNLLALDWE